MLKSVEGKRRDNMVNEVYEYTVDKKSEGKHRLARLGMIALYVTFLVGAFAVVMKTRLYPTFAIAPLLLWILILATWRYVSIEYKYTVASGMLELFTVYGGKKRKRMLSLRIKEIAWFLPLPDAADKIKEFAPTKRYDLRPSRTSVEDVYAVLAEVDGKRVLALIEAPKPSKKEILYYATEEVRKGANAK